MSDKFSDFLQPRGQALIMFSLRASIGSQHGKEKWTRVTKREERTKFKSLNEIRFH